MREEKKYLVAEVDGHLAKSDYVFLTDYHRITVAETAELRGLLQERGAEFHVVKNSSLREAAKARELPDLGDWLAGPTAVVVGGDDAPGVAKALKAFFKKKEKVAVKVGLLDRKLLSSEQVSALAEMPSLEAIRGQLLSLFKSPARRFVGVVGAAPRGLLNVIKAKAEKGA